MYFSRDRFCLSFACLFPSACNSSISDLKLLILFQKITIFFEKSKYNYQIVPDIADSEDSWVGSLTGHWVSSAAGFNPG